MSQWVKNSSAMYAGMCVCVDLGLANDALHYCAMLRHALTSESCCGFYSDVLLASHSTHSPLEVNRLRQNWLPILLLFILTLWNVFLQSTTDACIFAWYWNFADLRTADFKKTSQHPAYSATILQSCRCCRAATAPMPCDYNCYYTNKAFTNATPNVPRTVSKSPYFT